MHIYTGDALTVLKTLPDDSVHCCVTSPPYYGLRDYGTAQWFGGDEACDHLEIITGMSAKNTLGHKGHLPETNAGNIGKKRQYKETCAKCGATRRDSQIGLEESPESYVDRLTQVFAEVRRVLRNDGTLWLNLGDSYCSAKSRYSSSAQTISGKNRNEPTKQNKPDLYLQGYKDKDLLGIPWRVAFALQADGWYLRSDIIWHKPNPMPESVKDRPTKSHEYIFLLSKSERYFYDAASIREPSLSSDPNHINYRKNGRSDSRRKELTDTYVKRSFGDDGFYKPIDRNKRSVWTLSTIPYKEAHFATFPPELPRLCIQAGCPAGGTVIDPFNGAGTTGLVAAQLGRNYIGIELNAQYVEMSYQRIAKDIGGLALTFNADPQQGHPHVVTLS